ncbi:MAG: sodium-dependent transporter [Oscillospiraceae bacterium]|nr:sodium-dependent transporter [Oscillospiraceae bacterium]
MEQKRSSFTGSIGFVLAAAGSAVGLGNIWRFPYLAAKDGGGVFLLCYLLLALTFGFALLTTEIAIGRKTGQSPLTAYGMLHKKFNWIGVFACIVPVLILPYYSVIGGWILKYVSVFLTGGAADAAQDSYFTGLITAQWEPIIWFVIYLLLTTFVVYKGVDKGIERLSTVLMPILLVLIIGIAVFSLTLSHTDDAGVTRTGLQGLGRYVIPNFKGMSIKTFVTILMDAMGQLFYSISVAMGIMITYGSYVKKETNLSKSVNQIELFDTIVAFLAGLMIIPAVFTFQGEAGLANSGPGLMFKALPKIFSEMGGLGTAIGIVFFVMVAFAALTSSVSIMEAVVSCFMDKFKLERKKATIVVCLIALILGLAVCLGYNVIYFDLTLPNGTVGQVLDVMDYLSNYILMPIVAIATCILIGWVVKPKTVLDEVTLGGVKFGRQKLYVVMVKYVTPVMLFFLLLQSLGLFL